MKGELPGYGEVWYNGKGIANILSFAKVADKYNVAYDNAEKQFVVTKPDGKINCFKRSGQGLHFLEARKDGAVLINTVADNASLFCTQLLSSCSSA
jgi:hypothetical protein